MNSRHFLSTRRAEPEEVLAFFRDQYRHVPPSGSMPHFDRNPYDAWKIGFHSTVGRLRSGLSLPERAGYGKALNRIFGLALDKDEWEETLKPANKRTLRKLCNTIASRADWPTVEPRRICGKSSLAAGAFFTVRSLVAREGHDVANIRPSTLLEVLPREVLLATVRAVDFVAPGMLPNPTFRRKGVIRRHRSLTFGKFASFRDLAVGIVRDLGNRRSGRTISRAEVPAVWDARPEDIMEILQAEQIFHDRLDGGPGAPLTPQTTVSQWIRRRGLRDVFELQEMLEHLFNLRLAKGHWGHIVRPEKEKSVAEVCEAVARLYRLPVIKPFPIFGIKSLAVGAYLTFRALMAQKGVPPERLNSRDRMSRLDRSDQENHWSCFKDALLVIAPDLAIRMERKTSFLAWITHRIPFGAMLACGGVSLAALLLLWLVGKFDPAIVAALQAMSPVPLKEILLIGFAIGLAPFLLAPTIFSLPDRLGIPEYRINVRGVKNFRELAVLLAERGRVERGD